MLSGSGQCSGEIVWGQAFWIELLKKETRFPQLLHRDRRGKLHHIPRSDEVMLRWKENKGYLTVKQKDTHDYATKINNTPG